MARRDPDHLLLAFAYDGSPFHGVWPQPDVPTVAHALYARLTDALGRRPDAFAPVARTDTGVHATLNLATVRLWPDADTSRLDRATLPRDDGLTALRVRRVSSLVHGRGLAQAKRYRYAFDEPLDLDALRAAAAHLVGALDVTALRGKRVRPDRCQLRIDRLHVKEGPAFVIEGARFVRHQVRRTATLLARVGRGELDPDAVPDLLNAGDPRQVGPPAPGSGLTLTGLRVGGRWWTSVDQVDLEAVAAR